jgi:hypothetical protein
MNLIKLFVLVLFIVVAFLITGCSTTVPVVPKFPDVPAELMVKCPQLKTIETEDVSIIDFTKVTTINYTSYYECSTKVENWMEWYNEQKKVFKEIK